MRLLPLQLLPLRKLLSLPMHQLPKKPHRLLKKLLLQKLSPKKPHRQLKKPLLLKPLRPNPC
jgi:hypothetical protein